MRNIPFISSPFAFAIDSISWQIRPQICARRCHCRLWPPGVRNFQHGTGTLVPLAKEQEIIRVRLPQNNEVALHKSQRKPARCAGVTAFTDVEPGSLGRGKVLT
jgi:hypothetical protein